MTIAALFVDPSGIYTHAFFAPSAAERWIACPGSQAFPENTTHDDDAGIYAAEGSAAHMLADRALTYKKDASFFLGEQLQVGERVFEVNEDFCLFVQVYLDYCRNLAGKDTLLAEQQVDLARYLGVEGGGTADCVIIKPRELHVVDLKYGRGVRVSAERNPQCRLYGLGALDMFELFGPFDTITYHIVQPRLDSISTWSESVADALVFGEEAAEAVRQAQLAIAAPSPTEWLRPSEAACRWCRVRATCPALANLIARDVGSVESGAAKASEFEPVSTDNETLAAKYAAVPLILGWCKAVADELRNRVQAGVQIVGNDGLLFKMVQGRPGNAAWTDIPAVTAILTGQLADKAYEPATVVTPAVAKKLLGKKREKIWLEVIKPLSARKDGQPQLAMGSDPRDAYTSAATADEFNTEEDDNA
jgi:hypothetical protein